MGEILAVGPLTVDYQHRGNSHRALELQETVTVEEGEIFGLVGPSGCGKSTLLRVVAGLVRGWSGTVRLFGSPWTPPKAGRMPVQMVFQDPGASLHPWHTIGQTLAEPLRVAREADIENRVVRALEEVDLGRSFLHRRPGQLSGGQRQRAAIARALLLSPRLLLLDEPTSALDVSVQAGVLNLLERLRRDHGMTMILVSHDRGVVAHLCDRAASLEVGRWSGTYGRNSLDTWG